MSGTKTGHRMEIILDTAIDGKANGWLYPRPDLPGYNAYEIAGFTYTEHGFQRGNPENDDSYMFLTLSAYKKFNNAAKSYRTINMHQKRKIKASF